MLEPILSQCLPTATPKAVAALGRRASPHLRRPVKGKIKVARPTAPGKVVKIQRRKQARSRTCLIRRTPPSQPRRISNDADERITGTLSKSPDPKERQLIYGDPEAEYVNGGKEEVNSTHEASDNESSFGPTVKLVALDEICQDRSANCRQDLNEIIINEYKQLMAEGVVFPPVLLVKNKQTLFVGDGQHRLEAAKGAGMTHFPAIVTTGDRCETMIASLKANAKTGLRLTNKDKGKAVQFLLSDTDAKTWSDRRIADLAGCSDRFVAKLRAQLQRTTPNGSQIRTFNRGGKQIKMDVRNIGKKQREKIERAFVKTGPRVKAPGTQDSTDKVSETPRARLTIFTIGSAGKTAEQFFELLRDAEIRRVVDVRIQNSTQVIGFTKKDDLTYFLRELCGAECMPDDKLVPLKQLFTLQKSNAEEFKVKYFAQLEQHKIEELYSREFFQVPTAILCTEPNPQHSYGPLILEYLNKCWGNIGIVNLAVV
ncbi:MAG TPA: DUF488 family protein [Planctomycetota bacterium]|nr:DUF488 family protein [Planctomycetota bacterium]